MKKLKTENRLCRVELETRAPRASFKRRGRGSENQVPAAGEYVPAPQEVQTEDTLAPAHQGSMLFGWRFGKPDPVHNSAV